MCLKKLLLQLHKNGLYVMICHESSTDLEDWRSTHYHEAVIDEPSTWICKQFRRIDEHGRLVKTVTIIDIFEDDRNVLPCSLASLLALCTSPLDQQYPHGVLPTA